jgi:hypothetical protein
MWTMTCSSVYVLNAHSSDKKGMGEDTGGASYRPGLGGRSLCALPPNTDCSATCRFPGCFLRSFQSCTALTLFPAISLARSYKTSQPPALFSLPSPSTHHCCSLLLNRRAFINPHSLTANPTFTQASIQYFTLNQHHPQPCFSPRTLSSWPSLPSLPPR